MATGSAVVLGAVGGVLFGTAVARKSEIEELAAQREPGTGLPATSYADIKSRDDQRRLFSNVGTGFLIGGGVVGAVAVTLWLLPSGRSKGPAKKGANVFTTIEPQIGLGTVGLSGRF